VAVAQGAAAGRPCWLAAPSPKGVVIGCGGACALVLRRAFVGIYDLKVCDSDADSAVTALTDPAHAQSAVTFGADRRARDHPGLFAWSGDDEALRIFCTQVGAELPALLYAGQAGATRTPVDYRATETLASRIMSRHLSGTERSSTFRLNVSALLLEPLELGVLADGQLSDSANRAVSVWVAQHLTVSTFLVPDRDALAALEAEVVHRLDPPLNVDHMPASPVRERIAQLRARLACS